MEKNVVHGLQREHEEQVSAVCFPDLGRGSADWDAGAFASAPTLAPAGHYFIERAFGTDDLENFFSEVCRRSRSGRQAPNCQTAMLVARTAMLVARTAERAAKLLWDGRWRKYESKRKRYTKAERTTHVDWHCGARVPLWWRLDLPTAEQVVENQKVHAERRMAKEGKKKALYNASKVRSFHAAAGADTSIV